MRRLRAFQRHDWAVFVVMSLAIVHHVDHVFRNDHSGWPFREEVSPFSASLVIYLLFVYALLGSNLTRRMLCLGTIAAFVTVVHTGPEPPVHVWSSWVDNESIFWVHRGEPNLLDRELPAVAVPAVILHQGIMVAINAVFIWFAVLVDRERRARSGRGRALAPQPAGVGGSAAPSHH